MALYLPALKGEASRALGERIAQLSFLGDKKFTVSDDRALPQKPGAMEQIFKAAVKSDELAEDLIAVIAVDERRQVYDLPAQLVVTEARYVLDKFFGHGGFE